MPQSSSTNRSWLSGSNSARPTVMLPFYSDELPYEYMLALRTDEATSWQPFVRPDPWLSFHYNDIGDEYHYLLCCPLFREERKKYINFKFWKRPSTIQVEQLFKQNYYNNVLQLSLFVKVIIAKFKSGLSMNNNS